MIRHARVAPQRHGPPPRFPRARLIEESPRLGAGAAQGHKRSAGGGCAGPGAGASASVPR